jgi:hypothetical protein
MTPLAALPTTLFSLSCCAPPQVFLVIDFRLSGVRFRPEDFGPRTVHRAPAAAATQSRPTASSVCIRASAAARDPTPGKQRTRAIDALQALMCFSRALLRQVRDWQAAPSAWPAPACREGFVSDALDVPYQGVHALERYWYDEHTT